MRMGYGRRQRSHMRRPPAVHGIAPQTAERLDGRTPAVVALVRRRYATKESFVVRSGIARLARRGAYGTDRPFEPLGVRSEPDPPPDCGHDRGPGDSRPAAF